VDPLGTLWRFQKLIGPHRRGVELARAEARGLIPQRFRGLDADERNPVTYTGRNFFSLLLLSAYRALEFPDPQLEYLAAVNHTIRAVVTAADNLIDDEDKPVLALKMPSDAERFRNCLGLLAWGVALERVVGLGVERGVLAEERVGDAVQGLMALLVEIGAVEAEEEAGVDEVATPEEVIERIHEHKGGSLLGLAFVVPRFGLEADPRAPRLETMAAGIHAIGLALQHVDDVTDLEIDVARRSHNLLQSEIAHHGSQAERAFLASLRSGLPGEGYRDVCGASVGRVVARALETARRGLGLLQDAGYPLAAEEAMTLLQALFRVRGEAELLELARRARGG